MIPDDLWFADNPSRRYRLREASRPEADAVRAGMGHKERSAALHFWRIVGGTERAPHSGRRPGVVPLYRMIRITPLRNT
jgi:hypothetical protein